MQVRTRFAPSPTGYLHIGGLRTALYAYLFAKKHSGALVLRIEDTDQEREVPGAIEQIQRTLRLTGLSYDEGPDVGGEYGPYIQTQRRHLYAEAAKELVERDGAYYCFCTKERLDALRQEAEARGEAFRYDGHCRSLSAEEVQKRLSLGEAYVVRQKVPANGKAGFDDLLYGTIEVDNSELDDMVLLKSDGLPTYNFANVVDDHAMAISHVIRGSEYLSSSPKYNLIYEAMGWPIPKYIHLPPVMKTASRKLSKRDGDASFEDFAAKGYLAEAILNYIALLGWNPGTNQEKFTLTELVGAFDVSGLNKAPAIFDVNKLTWLNAEYIRELAPEKFTEYALPWYQIAFSDNAPAQAVNNSIQEPDVATQKADGATQKADGICAFTLTAQKLDILQRILQPRVEFFAQIPDMLDFLTQRLDYELSVYEHKKMKTTVENSLEALRLALPELEGLPEWTEEALHEALLGLAQRHELKNGRILWPVRVAVTGKLVSPGGAIEACALLGREESLARVNAAIARLESQTM